MTPEDLRKRLRARPLLLDGGMGTELLARGLPSGRAPEWWILERPEAIAAIHRGYAEAGCALVHAATFGASPPKLAASGLSGRVSELCEKAVRLARVDGHPELLVAGDIGPTGRMLPPVGDASPKQLLDAFRLQARALAEAGADLLSIETMYDVREAEAAVTAAAETGLAVMASMTFEKKRRGFFTIMGDRIVPSLTALANAGASVCGFNCSVTAREMAAMVEEAAELPVSIAAQPNAGQPIPTAKGIRYDITPERFAEETAALVAAGARAVGGCCGTTPLILAEATRRIQGAA